MLKKLESEEFPLSYHVGIFGSSGLTAYGGLFHVCKPKKGDKVFVSAAAGSVGNLVGQYAKLLGCYVVGCAGTKQKTYFDNVGGEMLETAVANMNPFGLFRVLMKLVDVDTMHIFPIMMLILSLVTGLIAFPFNDFDVFYYGASGSGQTDDSQAFVDAWRDACKADTKTATVIAPRVGSFLLRPLMFLGPCNPQIMHFIISGTIIASGSPETWKGLDSSQWIAFKDVTGLNVYGSGIIDGQGIRWWDQSCRYHPNQKGCTKLAPTVFKFLSCKDCTLSNIYIVNSPQTHVLISDSKGFDVDNVMIQAPQDSPNTDGIHIHSSHYVKITNSIIGTGDDCISIGDYTSNIDIANIDCGPGHGISVGSLGKSGGVVNVEKINVRDSSFKGTTNGARIKTWQVGQGNIRHITFENLVFDTVDNPIIIDQNYCDVPGKCKEQRTGVKISDVVYRNLYGTSSSKVAITLNCSRSVPCSGITMENINLEPLQPGKEVTASCINVQGTEDGVNPGSCLKR
nr:polygalacturonase QRT2-like [Tanacetum cinerariifolium]